MNVLVSDTSVLIDLERGEILQTSFALPFDFAVPDLLYRQELAEHGGPGLLELGLRIEDLDGDGVSLALHYRQADRSLSLPDSFALAQRNSWALLSGDGRLRELARSEDVACHGVLWLTDQMFEHGTLPGSDVCASLHEIASHPRSRLPMPEVRKRFRLYSNG